MYEMEFAIFWCLRVTHYKFKGKEKVQCAGTHATYVGTSGVLP